jgi:acyl-CoA thioester hydrolase
MPHAGPISSCGVIEVRVRYPECDPMGVAHHAAFPVWFEIGRTELLRQGGGNYRDLEAQGIFFAVARLSAHYRRPARYDDLLTLRTTITGTGRASIDHAYELYRGNELLATATTTIVCLDREGRPRALPESIDLVRAPATRHGPRST